VRNIGLGVSPPVCGGAGLRDPSTLEVRLEKIRIKWVVDLSHSPIIAAGWRLHLGNIEWGRAGRVSIVTDNGR